MHISVCAWQMVLTGLNENEENAENTSSTVAEYTVLIRRHEKRHGHCARMFGWIVEISGMTYLI